MRSGVLSTNHDSHERQVNDPLSLVSHMRSSSEAPLRESFNGFVWRDNSKVHNFPSRLTFWTCVFLAFVRNNKIFERIRTRLPVLTSTSCFTIGRYANDERDNTKRVVFGKVINLKIDLLLGCIAYLYATRVFRGKKITSGTIPFHEIFRP